MKTIYDAVRCGEPIDFTPFIDVHGHFGPWQYAFIPYASDHARLIAEMDRYGCDMVWMSAADPGYADAMAVKNDCVFRFAENYPDRIIPYCTLSANQPRECFAELERCLGRGRCIGVKMHRYHQAAYTLKEAFLQPVFELLAEKKLVYMNHELGDVETIAWAAESYLDLVFISGHFSPPTNDLALHYKNVGVCTCAAMEPEALGREVHRLGRSDTMLFGSDFGLLSLSFGIGMLAYADIPEQDKRNLLGLNALRLLARSDCFDLSVMRRLRESWNC